MSGPVALVDCNNFYVSCERVFQPELRDKPVVVLSNNDGCVIARSNEAKRSASRWARPGICTKRNSRARASSCARAITRSMAI